MLTKHFQWVVVFAQIFKFPFATIGLWIAHKVAVVSPLLGKYARRTVACAGMGNGLASRLMYSEKVSAISNKNGETERFGPRLQIVTADSVVNVCVLRVIVVFYDEDCRDLQSSS